MEVPYRVSEVPVSRATMADLPAILALFDEAVEWLGAKGITGQWGTASFSGRPGVQERFRAWIEGGALHVARLGDEVVGSLALSEAVPGYAAQETVGRPGPAFYLEAFTTKRQYQGRGIGGAMLTWAEAYAAEAGIPWLRLDCWAGNPALCGYYERAGYVPFGECRLGEWRGQLFEKQVSGR